MRTSTVIGPATFVRGNVSGDGDLEIAGRVEGDVACTGEIVIDTNALVAANVSGTRIVVRGAVKGDLVAEQGLVIEAGARVVGDLRAPRITIAPGGLVRGHVQTAGASATRPRVVAAPARASVVESTSRPVAPPPPARTTKPQSTPPPPSVVTKANHKPVSRPVTPSEPRPGPPPPVVPVLKKGTKAIQKKRA